MSTRFEIIDTSLYGLRIIQRKPIGDRRGYLERLFCSDEFEAFSAGKPIVQINHTFTAIRGTVRGMHFQRPPYAEIKFVSCMRGEVFDVAVDLRHNSSTFLHWHAEVLTSDNHKSLVIPEGFAHGFQTLTNDCELLYFQTAAYKPETEGGLHVKDSQVGIAWPLPVVGLSQRDTEHPFVSNGFKGFSA
jgi:dTDP-4-dehydrorhamnose 3,5-epimerase